MNYQPHTHSNQGLATGLACNCRMNPWVQVTTLAIWTSCSSRPFIPTLRRPGRTVRPSSARTVPRHAGPGVGQPASMACSCVGKVAGHPATMLVTWRSERGLTERGLTDPYQGTWILTHGANEPMNLKCCVENWATHRCGVATLAWARLAKQFNGQVQCSS